MAPSPDTDTGTTTVLNETLEVIDKAENVSFAQSVMVLAYTNYTVRVQASTGVGRGESTDTIILSPQAGIYALHRSPSSSLQFLVLD